MIKRQMYSMNHQVATYSEFGRMIPTMLQEVAPGDTWSGKTGLLVRLSPLKRALLHDIYVDQFCFYVPHRLVFAGWEDFISQGPMDAPLTQLPELTVGAASTQKQCLFLKPNDTEAKAMSALRTYAINLIHNEFFRDEQDPIRQPGDNLGNIGPIISCKKDYWSMIRDDLGTAQAEQFVDATSGSGTQVAASEILLAIAQQKIAMKRATYETRYIDILRCFGVNVNYQMLQRPEVVAISRGSVNVTDVVQTAPGAGGGEDALGSLAGHGISGTRLTLKRKTFPEHGSLITVCVVRPVYADTVLVDWFDTPREYSSYYDPGLVPLPPVEIFDRDIVMSSPDAVRDLSIGFQPWGEWYRGALSRIHPDLEEWTGGLAVGQSGLGSGQALRTYSPAQFDQMFTDTTFGHFQVSAVNNFRALRMLPRNNVMKSQTLG